MWYMLSRVSFFMVRLFNVLCLGPILLLIHRRIYFGGFMIFGFPFML